MIHLRADGKRVQSLSPRGWRYLLELVRDPEIAHYKAALRAGYSVASASRRAIALDKHPELVSHLKLLRGKAAAAAGFDATRWVMMVLEDRTQAKTLKRPDLPSALRADELLVTHVPMEGLLSGRDIPGPKGTTFNLNIATLFAGWSEGELTEFIARERAAIAEGLVVNADGHRD